MTIALNRSPPSRTRVPLYCALIVVFVLLASVTEGAFGAHNPRLLYLALLFALCATPMLCARRLNDRYALYTIFLVIYFVSFGMTDLIHLFDQTQSVGSTPLLSPAELIILVSGGSFALGYHCAVSRMARRGVSMFLADDWPMSALLSVGLILWLGGTYATWYWNVQLTVRSLQVNYASEGITTLLMMGRYAQPLGILILAYAYTISKSRTLGMIMLAVVAIQVMLGFVSNTKGLAMLGGILMVTTSYLVNGRVPKAWLLASLLFITVAFPIFQAYRTVVVGDRGLTNAEAASDIGKALGLAIDGRARASEEHVSSFFERSSVKGAVDMIVSRAGVDVAYQRGHTLTPLLAVFIPRLFWPDKPSVETGLLLNDEFHIADAIVYISPSHLGELYWNFGWLGAVFGMLLIGALLGHISALCDLSTAASVTRLLIVGIAIFEIGVRFEGSIASEYEVLIRSVAGILLLHLLFARHGLRRGVNSPLTSAGEGGQEGVVLVASERFPNLMA